MVPEARLELARLERRGILNPLRLPIPPLGHNALKWSGKRGSNSRPRPWQGRALPTELFPHTATDLLSVACILLTSEKVSTSNLKKNA